MLMFMVSHVKLIPATVTIITATLMKPFRGTAGRRSRLVLTQGFDVLSKDNPACGHDDLEITDNCSIN